jgi:hypothetical protein
LQIKAYKPEPLFYYLKNILYISKQFDILPASSSSNLTSSIPLTDPASSTALAPIVKAREPEPLFYYFKNALYISKQFDILPTSSSSDLTSSIPLTDPAGSTAPAPIVKAYKPEPLFYYLKNALYISKQFDILPASSSSDLTSSMPLTNPSAPAGPGM